MEEEEEGEKRNRIEAGRIIDPSHSQYLKKLARVHNTIYCCLQANPCDV